MSFVATDPKLLAEALRATRAEPMSPERAKREAAILTVTRTGKRCRI